MAISKRILFSYILDWAVILVFAAISAGLNSVKPQKPPFSLSDLSISLPYKKDTISIALAGIVCVVLPAAIIAFVCCVIGAWRAQRASAHLRRQIWRRELWDWFSGWLGLGLSVVAAFFFAQAVKNLIGKPRPDFLARCNPDSSSQTKYATESFDPAGSVLVSWEICQSKNGGGVGIKEFEDGFRSFPSGHCNIAFSGLLYLTLFLATKFSVGIPFLTSAPSRRNNTREHGVPFDETEGIRNQNAAAPLYLVALVLIPFGAAIYIASTRFSDGKHHGFDVIISSITGSICAYFAFRWYHLPITRGGGRSWAPRSADTAFGISVGHLSYVRAGNDEIIGEGDPEQGAYNAQYTVQQDAIEMNNLHRSETGGSRRPLRRGE